MKKRNDDRARELEIYNQQKEGAAKLSDEEERKKQELIKRGMAALNMKDSSHLSEQEIQEKRKNFMAGIRDAIVSGGAEEPPVQKKKKKKKAAEGGE